MSFVYLTQKTVITKPLLFSVWIQNDRLSLNYINFEKGERREEKKLVLILTSDC